MSNSYPTTRLSIIVILLCMVCTTAQGKRELPLLTVTPSTTDKCLTADNRQDSLNLIRNATCEVIYGDLCSHCGRGNWRRVFYLNASRSDQTCPGQWSLVTSPIRGCGGADTSCRSAFSDDISTSYSKVCGRIIGESVASPDAFLRSRYTMGQNSVQENYLDGVSVTHGAPGSRTHIWTLGAGHIGRCPCDNSDRSAAPLPPAEVGDNYFCDRAGDELNHLWSGESCASDNPCCSFNNPP